MPSRDIQEDLFDFLDDIARADSDSKVSQNISDYKQRLDEIYRPAYQNQNLNFRHLYSEIFKKIIEFDSNATTYSIDVLSENIDQIFNSFDQSDEAYNYVMKFYDHIMLDISRIGYMRTIDRKTEQMRVATTNSYEGLQQNYKEVSKKFNEIKTEIRSQKFDLVALVTLVFSAFALITTNVSLFSAAVKNFNDIVDILSMLLILNITLVLSIFSIYTIIRKMHGSISDNKMYISLIIPILCLFGLLVIFS